MGLLLSTSNLEGVLLVKGSEVKDCFLSIQIIVEPCIYRYHDLPITNQNIVLSFIFGMNDFTCDIVCFQIYKIHVYW